MKTALIRPGLLVSLKTAIRGGVSYEKTTLEADHQLPDASKQARWETTRRIANAEEFEAARVARGKCRSLVAAACCPSTFGLLCPESNEEKLLSAITEAQAIANAHNSEAMHSRVEVFVITGRVADSDVQAARAIGSEVRDLIASMEAGVRAGDAKAIREAAGKARAVSGMLSPEVQAKVSAAIAEVRSVARDIVKRVGEGGEQAAAVVEGLKLDAIQNARFAVLDLTGEWGDVGDTLAAANTGRALDLEPEGA